MGILGPVLWFLSAVLTLSHSYTSIPIQVNSARSDHVCSTWGKFQYKTFDGDFYQFPGTCNYLLTSNCLDTVEDFNIQIRHSEAANETVVSHIMIKIVGLVIEMNKDVIMVGGKTITVPYSHLGIQIQYTGVYVKVSSKLGVSLLWNADDALTVKVPPKYINRTCGLCGNMNGNSQDEFAFDEMLLTPVQFGNLQKLNGPTELCADVIPPDPKDCNGLYETCVKMLSNQAFSDCEMHLPQHQYVQACISDLCSCQNSSDPSCACDTLAEYSRQCAIAGGKPQDWRTNMCERTCPGNMKYEECGSPCADTCSNSDRTRVCEELCLDGCYCPNGTVFDDVGNRGCIPLSECTCSYNNKKYATGESYTSNCHNCTCQGGQWSCKALHCAGRCSLEGGSHIYTYDNARFNFHGDCTYVFSKDCVNHKFTLLTELKTCGVTNTETCLKSVTLSLDQGQTLLTVKSSGAVLLNGTFSTTPLFAENVAVLQPSSFYLIIQRFSGIQIQVQLIPVMQISVTLDPEYHGNACGLCGDFNNIQTDDFRSLSGALEGTAAAFANTWKSQSDCNDVKDSYENPCSLSVDNEQFAQQWCSQLSDSTGPFALCHAAVNPEDYEKNCMYDSCNYENSVDSVCAAHTAYVRACAAENVILVGWRGTICDKYTKTCTKNSTYQYSIRSCQQTCRSMSEPDPSCSFHFTPLDGCVCPNGTFLDENGACVAAEECPCYYKGSAIPPGEVIYDNSVMCTCQNGRLSCIAKTRNITDCPPNMIYFDCANASRGAKGAECQKTCQTLDMECFSIQCASGCVCPHGLVLSNNGSCVLEKECPCVHNGISYYNGESIQQDCNNCTCKNHKWQCTKKECYRSCVVYGDGHFVTFDGKRFDFNGDCEYTVTQDYCASNSGNGSFRIITENIPCGTTGATCSKAIKLFLGNYELQLSEGSFEVVERDIGGEVPYQIRQMGIYLVIEANNGLILMWDKKTSILIKLSPEFKGNVCGLCGNYDGSVSNDFITRSLSVVVNVQEFGNSWKALPTCPDDKVRRDPCVANPYRQTWSQKQCSIIMGPKFSKCHSKVDPTAYYEACVSDTCACDSGGDCECYCTAVAAYAAACSEAGVCTTWRTPEICPLFCDFYNPEGECEWHYKPCGSPCLKTCRNPSGQCMNQLQGFEGCYPKCPKQRPFFDEDTMKCVAQASCGCYDDDNKRYNVGDMVPSYKNLLFLIFICIFLRHADVIACLVDTEMSNLSFSICTKKGRRCQMNVRACSCYYANMKYNYGDIIYNTTDGIGGCIIAICSTNGTIARSVSLCVSTTTAPATTFQFGLTTEYAENASTPVSTPPTSVSCLEEVCKWSQWYDVTCPKYGNNEGDFETFQNVRRKGHSICKAPSSVQCRAQKFPKIPIADLGQIVQCNKSMGLICHNRDQFSQLCFNYEIKILCCSYVPCSETVKPPISVSTSSPPLISATSKSTKTTLPSTVASKYTVSTKPSHSTQSSVKTTVTFTSDVSRKTSAKPHQTSTRSQEASLTTPCKKQMCTWSPWYDVHFPSIVASDGDFETLDNIRAAGNNICQTPQEIECRAEKFPDKNITDIGQIVICNTTNGLICNNRDQDFNFPLCYNYKVRIFCCSMVDCESTTTSVHTTVKDHTSRQSQETSVLTRTTVHKSTESGVTSNKTTSKIMSSTPHLDHTSLVTGTEFKSTVYSSVSTKTTRTPNETATSSHIIVSSKSTPLTSLPAFKTTQTNVGTVKTFTLPKTTASTSFESVLTSKPVTRTEPASQKQDHTSQTEVTPLKTTTVPSSSSKYASETSIAKHTASTAGDHHTTTTSLLKTSMIQTPTTGIRVSSAQTSAVTRTTAGSFESILTSIPLTESTMINTFTNTNVSIYPLYSTTEEKELHTSITISHTSKITTPKAFSTTGKISCIPTCQWSQWFDVSFPNINTNGDFETYEDIRKSGFAICQEPTDIQCRSADLPDIPLEELQQNVQCNVSYGLSCQNEDQMGPFPYCLNYEIRVLCCSACASTEVLPTFTQPETSKLSWHITEQSPPEETSKTLTTATPKEKTTKERVPFSESTIETTLSKSSTYLKTESSQPYTTHKTDSIKTSKMATTSGEVTLTNTDYSKYSSLSTSKSSQEDHSTSHGPISSKVTTPTIKLTTMEEVYTYTPMQKTSRLITAPLEMTTRKSSTAEKKSTVKESTSSSGKTTRETGPMTSTYKSTPFIPITTKVTSPKVSTAHLKFTTESEHEITSQGLISIKTTEISREPIMTKATSPKVSSISQEITTESQYEATTAYKSVPFKTTRLSTESTELKAALVSLPDVPMTTKLLVPLLSTISQRATTENKETSSHGLVSIKTTHTSKESSEVTSAHKSTPSEPINTKATSPQVNTISHESTTESEHEEFTSQVPISIKTTKLSTASGKVTSAQKITSGKPMTTKATSPKLGTISHKSTTESEQEETISPGPISIKTTKLSTASGEVTSEKPMTTKATSPKLSTTSYKSTTESEQEETTSPGWISSQITKMSTESKEVTSSYKSSPGKPITTKAISSKITTISAKSTTESEHEEMTSHVAGSMKTTKMSTESGEVTSEHISVSSSKPVTTKATSLKVSTIPHKFTTESEHEKYTSQGLISIKTTKLSTARASGEVTSEKPMTTIATSPKLSTISHKSTTESEQEETTSTVWISSKTTKMSTESGVVTSSYKSSPGKPITTKVTSSKITTISPKSTTEYEHEEITSQVAGSMKTTKMSTRSGEVTSEHISVASKPVGTKATSLKVSTIPHKSTTESEHEEYTSQGPSSIKTTKLSTASGEVTSEKPMTTKATSPKLSTISYKSITESEQEETTSPGWISSQTTKMSTESGEVTSSYKSSPGKLITTTVTSSKITTISPKSTTESEHEEITSHVAGFMKTTKMSTGSREVTSEHIAVSSKPVTTKATSLKVSTIPHKSTTESEHEEFTSQGPISIKTTKLTTESGEVTSVKPMTSKATSPKLSTIPQKSTTESEQEKTTSTGRISSKTTKMSTESGEVTSSYKSSPGKPITTTVSSSKISTISPKSTTKSEHEEITSQVAGSMKTTKMSTGSGEVTSEHIAVSSKPVTTKATSLKVSTIPHKSTTESEHEEFTSQGPISIKTTKLSTASGEMTSEKPMTTKATSPKLSTISHKSTTESEQEETTSTGWISSKTTKMSTTISPKSTIESEHEEITSQVAGSMKTTKMSTGSGEVTSEHIAVSSKPVTTKATSLKVSTIPHKSTTESQHEEFTSQGPISTKTTKLFTASGKVKSVKPMTSKATSPKLSTIPQKSTTESEQEETTSTGWISSKTTKMSTESGEVTSSFKSSPGKPITTKATSSKITTISPKSTTESEHEEITSQVAGSVKTTKMSTGSGEVTSEHISVSSKPVTTKATSLKVSTIPHKFTTESEHEKYTSQGLISIKTTKLSTASGEVTSEKPITTKATSPKSSTIPHKSTTESEQEETTSTGWISSKTTKMSTTISPKSTTESEHEEITSQVAGYMKTTKMSTGSREVTSEHVAVSSKPVTIKATSLKVSTIPHKSTTESEQEETTSSGWIASKTTKLSTESGEVTSSYKSSPGKPITAKSTSSKITTISPKSTTESEHEEITSQVAGSMKTTKMSTASGEVTSEHISVFSKPVTTKATSLKVSTIPHKSTTESEHEEFTSNGPISIKTTKLSTESGEGTSAQKFTSEKPMTTKATSPKLSTISHKSTTESEQEETTSPGWIFSKTTKMSTASGEMTSERPTAKATSPKLSTISHKSTTESQQEETTSPHRISLKTTKMSTESGEVTFSYKSSPGKPITTKATSSKKTTISLKSTTESEHEEITSQVAGSMKTTKMSTQGEVTSPYKSSPTGSIAASTRISTVRTASRGTASYSASTVTAGAEYSSQQPKSTKQATFSTLGKVSTENTITKSSQLTTAAAESFSTARCMCNVNRVLVSPGNLLYNTTDNAGWCFYARCNETCQVESYSEQCQVSTVPTIPSSTKTAKTVTTSTGTGSTTKTVSTRTSQTAQTKTSATSIISVSTPPPGCSAVMPPRKVNESWMIDQCTKATCTGQNNIAIKKTQCAPVSEVVCANRLQPKNTYDESGCCYQKECECVCGGWGTSHYITFDGVYYSFNGQCTYVLVQQITPVFDHFRVYIDNFSCVPADPSCIKTLRIMYKTDTIVLTSHSLNNQVINEVYINNERAYPAVLTNGITITSSGIFVVVQIPEIGAYISFGVLSFSIKVPISKFSGNTEGHCGKCTNNQLDDCILPDGQLAPSCPLMASQWGVPSEGSSSCSSMSTSVPTTSTPATLQYSSLPSTYVSTLWSSLPDSLPTTVPATEISLLPSTFSSTTQTTQEPCNTPEICKIILSSVFEDCHKVAPPEPFYQACITDGCIKNESDVICSNLQSYAWLCAIQGVCVDWRNSTNGVCTMNCTSDLEYKACGPAVEPTCNPRYNEAFFNKSRNDFMEGCYCPEGTTKFNTITHKCVTTCGCAGPDGMPREPGETWESNCQTCICDNATMSVQCAARSCAMPMPTACTEEGSMLVSVLDPSNPCCQITECRCNISLCSNIKKTCEPGYETVPQMDAGGCCPVYKCVPKDVCVHNGSKYQPGGLVPSSNPCEKCMCDSTMNETSGQHHVSCTPVLCSIKCAKGFMHQEVPGQCCGTCVQAQCIMDLPDNSTYLLNPGETWSPPGDNCTEYKCVQKKDKLLTVSTKMSCPNVDLDNCVPGTIQKDDKGCCPTCIQKTKCQKVKAKEIILQNGCKSLNAVEMSYCKGNCESQSKYSTNSQSMEQTCGCCKETTTEMVTIDLSCPNGTVTKYTFITVKSCSCSDSPCNKHNEDDADKSHLTKPASQNTTNALKPTGKTEDSNEKQSENESSELESVENKQHEKNVTGEKESKQLSENQVTKPVTKITEGVIKITNSSNGSKSNETVKDESGSEQTHESKITMVTEKAMNTRGQSMGNTAIKQSNKTVTTNVEDGDVSNSKNGKPQDNLPEAKPVTKLISQSTQKTPQTAKLSSATGKEGHTSGTGK